MSDEPKTMAERLRAAGIKVREPASQGVVIPGARAVIDLAMIDTIAGEHWLRPGQRLRGNPRLEAIRRAHREKHRQRERDKKR